MNAVVKIVDDRLVADSRDIAAAFEKQHSNVLRGVDELLRDAPDLEINFDFKMYPIATGKGATRHARYCEIDRRGFMVLVMGFTGKKAIQLKIEWVDEFDRMEAALRGMQQSMALPAPEPSPIMDDLDRQRLAIAFVRAAHLAKRCPVARRAWLYKGMPDVFTGTSTPMIAAPADPAVQLWLVERVEAAPGERTPTGWLHEDYQHWCAANGRYALNISKFGEQLNRAGVAKKMSNGSWRLDVRLRPMEVA